MNIKSKSLLLIILFVSLLSYHSVQAINQAPRQDTEEETQCFDNRDDDNDGYIDCKDIDCFGKGYCQPIEVECNDGRDNDGNGKIDCADPLCSSSRECTQNHSTTTQQHGSAPEKVSEICDNGKDDNQNGLIDCVDTSCLTQSICNQTIINELFCNDGIDNDGDGFVDCEESECTEKSQGTCEQKVESSCKDGKDNDGDGKVDCADNNCMHKERCSAYEICNDGVDNNGDGETDCLDTACKDQCSKEICSNEQDNDNDGLAGCKDIDCHGSPTSKGVCEMGFELSCNDGFDNDGDTLVDCLDHDCKQSDICSSECGNGIQEQGEQCDDGNTKEEDGCSLCMREEPTCEIGLEHNGKELIVRSVHTRFTTQNIAINQQQDKNIFTEKKIFIEQPGDYTLYRQARNEQGIRQCEKIITIKTIQGCNDPTAINYQKNANYNNGTCKYRGEENLNCKILQATKTIETEQTIYDRNIEQLSSGSIRKVSLFHEKEHKEVSPSTNSVTILGEEHRSQTLIQIIKKNGATLSCTVHTKT